MIQIDVLYQDTRTSARSYPFNEYEWDFNYSNASRRVVFNRQFISHESIAGTPLIVPVFDNKQPIDYVSPKITDRFYLVPRSYVDRSGWEDPIVNEVNLSAIISEESQHQYIARHSIVSHDNDVEIGSDDDMATNEEQGDEESGEEQERREERDEEY